jgi:hypothetical protein
VPPVSRLAEGGVTETDERVIAAAIAMGTAGLILVVPFNVALTNRAIMPGVFPAVKVTDALVVELRFPNELVSVQEYVVSPEHVPPVHLMVAVKGVLPPTTTLLEDGLTVTDAS